MLPGNPRQPAIAIERADSNARQQDRITLWVAVVAVAAFGPYLILGIRTEQLALYGSMLLAIAAIAMSTAQWSESSRVAIFLWASLAAIALVGAVIPVASTSLYNAGGLLPGIDNVLSPLALLLLGAYWLTQIDDDGRVLDTVAWATVVLSVANAVFAFLQFFGVPLDGFLSRFWNQGEKSVALLVSDIGRFTGVFNQPAEAGLMYSLALLCLAYLWVRRPSMTRRTYGLLLVALVGGSLLSQSKMVLLVGIPVTAALLLIASRSDRRARAGFVVLIAVLVPLTLAAIGASSWNGSERIAQLVTLDTKGAGGVLDLVTANRYGNSSVLAGEFSTVIEYQPAFGFGATGLDIATDSAWLEVLSVSGLVGLAFYVLLLGYLLALAVRHSQTKAPSWSIMAYGLVMIAALEGFGLPIATANRAGTIFWLLVTFTFFGLRLGEMRRGAVGPDDANLRPTSPDRFPSS